MMPTAQVLLCASPGACGYIGGDGGAPDGSYSTHPEAAPDCLPSAVASSNADCGEDLLVGYLPAAVAAHLGPLLRCAKLETRVGGVRSGEGIGLCTSGSLMQQRNNGLPDARCILSCANFL